MLNGFVKVRRGIVEHLHNGQMNMTEFACYCMLLLKADYKTGVAWVRSSDFMLGDVSMSSVQRALQGLEDRQYIRRFATPGSKKPYPVLIDKFEICNGSEEDAKRINAVKSTSWKYPIYETGEEPLRSRWGGDHEAKRSRRGGDEDETTTPEESTVYDPKEVRSNNLEEISEKEELEDMNIKNALTDKAREILGVRIGPQDSNWPEIKALVRVYGDDAVTSQFERWAKTLKQPPTYPLSGFIRIADGLLSGKFSSSVSPESIAELVNDLVVVSDGRVVFNNNQKQMLATLLDGNDPTDIKSAFSEFWGNIENDDFAVRQAAKTFTEAAEQLLAVQARRREKERATAELLRQSTESEQARVRQELEARIKEAEATEALIEDTLGG